MILSNDSFNYLVNLDKGSFPKPFISLDLFQYELNILIIKIKIQQGQILSYIFNINIIDKDISLNSQ